MYKCVIFDLDGTLLDTLDDLGNAGNYALEVQGFPVHEIEKYKYFVGNGIPKLIERILPNCVDENVRKETYELFCSYYNAHTTDNTKPYEGIIELLSFIHGQGIKIAVVTNKAHDFAIEIINHYFAGLIDCIYGAVEGYPKKPSPYWVNIAINNFGFEKKEILYIGDSGVDIETAINAGVESCGVLWGFRTKSELVEAGCNHICSVCNDIKKLILES